VKMPEACEVQMMLQHATKHQLIGRKIIAWIQPLRTSKNGEKFSLFRHDLSSFIKSNETCITSLDVRGNKLALEIKTNEEYNTIVYNFSLGAVFGWIPLKDDQTVDFPDTKRINHYFIFEGYSLAWVLVDCSSFKNFAFLDTLQK